VPEINTDKKVIMVVDDEPDIQFLVKAALTRKGYQVVTASNGKEALQKVDELLPDLIVLDIMMPEMDGRTVLKELRARPGTSITPVLMLTALSAEEEVMKSLGLGADDYITKPFHIQEFTARVKAKLDRPPVPVNLVQKDNQIKLLNEATFNEEVKRELERSLLGSGTGCLAYLELAEINQYGEQLGATAKDKVLGKVATIIETQVSTDDIAGWNGNNRFMLLMPGVTLKVAHQRLETLNRTISGSFGGEDGELIFTPVTGYCNFVNAHDYQTLLKYTRLALAKAATSLDMVPYRFETSDTNTEPVSKSTDLTREVVNHLQFPIQVILVALAGWVFPFFLYTGLESLGFSIVFPVYLLLVLNTFFLTIVIWAEGLLSIRYIPPPLSPHATTSYPPASAIISVYLPECAATIVDTIRKYLIIDYPGSLQIVLAYHTDVRLPVEELLERLSKENPRLVLHKVKGQSTKAQNINSALATVVNGEFVGIFESIDEPDQDSFRRAWHWLGGGYDVVQGHNLIKNGDASFISRLSVIEGESYYAASLPGKIRLGKSIPFGGTNNYWRTGVLKQARLRSAVQTSVTELVVRVTLEGRRIAYDRLLVARRLAPVSWSAWATGLIKRAQGWYQVMLKHSWHLLWDKKLSLRQKLSYSYSLFWREISRWLLLQFVPLLAFFVITEDYNSALTILLVTFLSVGPGQTLLTYTCAHPDIRKHKRWFVEYLLVVTFFFTDLKRFLASIGQIRELLKASFSGPVIAPQFQKEDYQEEAPAVPMPVPGNVLVVDDDQYIRQLVKMVLNDNGYTVFEAGNGREALSIIENNRVNLIVSDLNMPVMDGYSLLENVRGNSRTAHIPVIILAISSTEPDIVKAFNMGADDYLVKPARLGELIARVKAKIERPTLPGEALNYDPVTNLPSFPLFKRLIEQELKRASRTGSNGSLAVISFEELESLTEKYGNRVSKILSRQIESLMLVNSNPLDRLGMDEKGNFLWLLPDTEPAKVREKLAALSTRIVNYSFKLINGHVRITPITGFSGFGEQDISVNELLKRAETAMSYSMVSHDLQPQLFNPRMLTSAEVTKKSGDSKKNGWKKFQARVTLPFQLAITYFISFVIPLLLYFGLDGVGFNVASYMYIVIVISLVMTAGLIWVEGILALRTKNIPPPDNINYPPAAAIIAAYMPNEAATIIETIEAFLKLDYPGELKIILAYNTPRPLPIESVLTDIAWNNPRFTSYKVENSTSKAQNVNAALALLNSEFVGVFDADHHPDPDSFKRAWHKLSQGYDVVQGHCLVRNGDATWVARMVAVEFEAIYSVSHPGRAALHDFGIFGGSNGYWRTELLRQTRMHGFMLTEDIDSSMRVTLEGYKIASDPHLVSRELATVNLKALWNQRMRWAQGWFQVSLRHTWGGITSKNLTVRQKFGLLHLLAWRELYPWLAGQVIPIIIFWAWKFGGIDKLDWLVPIFLLTTLLTMSVGPSQTILAYLKADPEIKNRKKWFYFYFFISSIFYTEFKNLIARVAQVKEFMMERQWKVTPRPTTPAKESSPPLA
jgi:PleD family two-component response regulator/cellulose synthase/poly-beta-1,6-N-acetylglucosamine synthase-like glycosyltransferase